MTSSAKALVENQRQVINKILIPKALKGKIKLGAGDNGICFIKIENQRKKRKS